MINNTLPVINSHDSWSPLQEAWLGDVYPASWYDHLTSEVRDVFYRHTDITQQDLSIIHRALEGFGVTVRRPRYDSIDDFVDIWLYRAEMYTRYFDADAAHIYTVPLHLLWKENIQPVLHDIETWFDLDIDLHQAQILHDKWRCLNFGAGPVV